MQAIQQKNKHRVPGFNVWNRYVNVRNCVKICPIVC